MIMIIILNIYGKGLLPSASRNQNRQKLTILHNLSPSFPQVLLSSIHTYTLELISFKPLYP